MWFSKRLIGAALLLAISVTAVSWIYLGGLQATGPVVVAARDIPAYARITPDLLEVVDHPLSALHPQSLEEGTQAVGRYVEHPIAQGRPLLSGELVEAGEERGELAWRLSGEQRAMAVPARPSDAAGGALRPGHRVDVIYYREPSVHGGGRARRLLHFVPVLDVRTAAGASWDPDGPEAPSDVLLSVTVSQAERLAYAMATGRLFLVVSPHHPEGGSSGMPGGVGGDELFRGEGGDPYG